MSLRRGVLAMVFVMGAATVGASGAEATPLRQTPAGQAKYLLWDVAPLGIDSSTALLLVELLSSEMRRVLGVRFLPSEEAIDATTRGLVAACGGTNACLTEVGLAAGADRLVVGVASSVGTLYNLRLKLIDTRSGEVLSSQQTSLQGDRNLMLPALQQLVLKLIDPTLLSGRLVVDVPMDGVTVQVDGLVVGVTPLLGPIDKIPVGEHTLKLSSPIIEDYFSFVSIQHDKTSTVSVSPKEIEALRAAIAASSAAISVPLHKRWWFWSLAAGAVAVAGGTAVVLTRAASDDGLPPATLGDLEMR